MKNTLMALALGAGLMCAGVSPASAKIRRMEIDFTGDISFTNSQTPSGPVEIDGAEWLVKCGKGVTAGAAMSAYLVEGFESAQRFVLPAGSTGNTSYLTLSTDAVKGLDLRGVEVYAWVHGSSAGNVRLSANTANAADITLDSMRVEDGSSVNKTEAPLEPYSAFRTPVRYVGQPDPADRLKLYFTNKGSASTAIAIGRVVVEYDDGVLDPVDLSFSIDGQMAESGCTVQPGATLIVDTGDAEGAQVTYLLDDSSADDIFPTEGIVLDRPGTFTYHFTVTAPERETTYADFTVTVAGENGMKETIDFADYEKYGLTLFNPDSDEYETTRNFWVAGDVNCLIPLGQKVRMEMSEAGVPMLMFAPGAYMEINVDGEGHKILAARLEGVGTENMEYEAGYDPEPAFPVSGYGFRSKRWDSQGNGATMLLLTNTGDVKVGLSSIELTLDENVETGVRTMCADEDGLVEYYDLTGRKMGAPERGVCVERRGSSSRLVIVR